MKKAETTNKAKTSCDCADLEAAIQACDYARAAFIEDQVRDCLEAALSCVVRTADMDRAAADLMAASTALSEALDAAGPHQTPEQTTPERLAALDALADFNEQWTPKRPQNRR